jgi:hypothetical protein
MALLTEQDISNEERAAFKLYKSNSPFERFLCFTDALNEALALGKPLSDGYGRQKELLDGMFERSSLPYAVSLYRATWDGYLAPTLTATYCATRLSCQLDSTKSLYTVTSVLRLLGLHCW